MTPEKVSPPDTAPRPGFEARVLAAFAAAGVAVLLLGAITWKLARDADAAALRVAHTHEVLVDLARLRADSLQIELSSQYFRLTGDPARLTERDKAIAARETSLRRLGELTADNPAQQARLRQMRDIVAARLAVARRVEQLRKEQGPEAAAAFAAGAGLGESLARLLALRDEMRQEENRLLEERSLRQRGARGIALAAASFTALALLGLFVGTYVLIRRQLRALAEHEAALREANAALAQANRLKSEFLAGMSHELRTPLNAIIGFSEVLKDGVAGEVSAQQREYLQDIFASGTHLLSLIDDILDLSKVEAGRMTLEPASLAVQPLLAAALSIVREKAAAHRLALALDVAADCGEIQADARKLKQIVYNLLSNAVKFTPDGGRVTLSARRVFVGAEAPAGDWLEIAVADTGIGISEENQKKLFAAFTQLDSSLSRRYAGTGLGLALVKRLVELHGGTVGLESEPGKGSTFRVRLPYRRADAPGA